MKAQVILAVVGMLFTLSFGSTETWLYSCVNNCAATGTFPTESEDTCLEKCTKPHPSSQFGSGVTFTRDPFSCNSAVILYATLDEYRISTTKEMVELAAKNIVSKPVELNFIKSWEYFEPHGCSPVNVVTVGALSPPEETDYNGMMSYLLQVIEDIKPQLHLYGGDIKLLTIGVPSWMNDVLVSGISSDPNCFDHCTWLSNHFKGFESFNCAEQCPTTPSATSYPTPIVNTEVPSYGDSFIVIPTYGTNSYIQGAEIYKDDGSGIMYEFWVSYIHDFWSPNIIIDAKNQPNLPSGYLQVLTTAENLWGYGRRRLTVDGVPVRIFIQSSDLTCRADVDDFKGGSVDVFIYTYNPGLQDWNALAGVQKVIETAYVFGGDDNDITIIETECEEDGILYYREYWPSKFNDPAWWQSLYE